MNSMRIAFTVLMLLLGILPVSALAESMKADEASRFFANYVALGDRYDPALANLYSNDAVIRSFRRYPHGLERNLEISAAQWKALIHSVMPLAKAKGDRSVYSNIEISVNGARAKIRASRYSVIKCYVDANYYMVVEKQADSNILILEEYSETQPQSDC